MASGRRRYNWFAFEDANWWALALGACFGGNATMIAAAANVAATGVLDRSGQPISFGRFLMIGAPVTYLTGGRVCISRPLSAVGRFDGTASRDEAGSSVHPSRRHLPRSGESPLRDRHLGDRGRRRGAAGCRPLHRRRSPARPFPRYLADLRHTAFLRDEPDALAVRLEEARGNPVERYMREPMTVDIQASAIHVAERFLHSPWGALAVVENERFVGMVDQVDFIETLMDQLGIERG